jgi:hypothetical protein
MAPSTSWKGAGADDGALEALTMALVLGTGTTGRTVPQAVPLTPHHTRASEPD